MTKLFKFAEVSCSFSERRIVYCADTTAAAWYTQNMDGACANELDNRHARGFSTRPASSVTDFDIEDFNIEKTPVTQGQKWHVQMLLQ